MITNQTKVQHLLWRAGFGPGVENMQEIANGNLKDVFKRLQKDSKDEPVLLQGASNVITGLINGVEEFGEINKKEMSPEDRKTFRKQSQEDIKSLNLQWISEMVDSNQQLREKMSFFWHGHFASRNLNIFYQQGLLDIIRKNALGNFGDLLKEVSKSAAMIYFLSNDKNVKAHPNENFAREVMELFTMGRGNYTEKDIQEAARAFTGWSADLKGKFVFRKNKHDDGTKTVLGKTGNFDGDAILDLLLEQKATAKYIVAKVYRFFVNEKVDETIVAQLADRFFKSKYDINDLMQTIFTSDWFYAEKNMGVKIKSPIELWVGIRRMLPMQLEETKTQLLIQRLLGQILFYPPNVAGWPGGKNWIDSSTLLFRMRIPQILSDNDEIGLQAKSDDDVMMGMKDEEMMEGKKKNGEPKRNSKKGMSQINANIKWESFTNKFDAVQREQLYATVSSRLLQTDPSKLNKSVIEKYVNASSRADYLKTLCVQVMSTPEYQLC